MPLFDRKEGGRGGKGEESGRKKGRGRGGRKEREGWKRREGTSYYTEEKKVCVVSGTVFTWSHSFSSFRQYVVTLVTKLLFLPLISPLLVHQLSLQPLHSEINVHTDGVHLGDREGARDNMVLSFQTRRKELGSKQAGEADMLVTVTVQFGKSSTILSAVAMLVLQSTNLEIVEYCHTWKQH